VDAPDDEEPVRRSGLPEDDRADHAPLDAVAEREQGEESGKKSHGQQYGATTAGGP
jgi:hypothetical protein